MSLPLHSTSRRHLSMTKKITRFIRQEGFILLQALDFLGSQQLFDGVVSYKETLSAQWVGNWFKRQLLFVPTLKIGAVQSALSDEQLTLSSADFLFSAGGDGVAYPVRGYPIAVINTCTKEKRGLVNVISSVTH